MQWLSRILLGLGGALLLVVGTMVWFNTADALANVGLNAVAAPGWGTARADIGGFFIVCGGLGLVAAITLNPRLIWPAQVLLLAAFTGRLLTLFIDGTGAAGPVNMGIEVMLLGVMQWCRSRWPSQSTV